MTDKSNLDRLVTRLVDATDPDEVKLLYRQWADTYDSDLDCFGYVAPQLGTIMFSRLIKDKSAAIHDAGCGTGLVGKLLNSLGYSHIDGSDFSPDMLQQARQTDCYRELQLADYSRAVNIDSNSFNGVISIGVYTRRFKQHFITEMLRIIKPGGYLLFTCRPLYYEEVAQTILQLHLEESISSSSVKLDDYMTGQDASAYYVSLQKQPSNTK